MAAHAAFQNVSEFLAAVDAKFSIHHAEYHNGALTYVVIGGYALYDLGLDREKFVE
jgi:hypothetical protein